MIQSVYLHDYIVDTLKMYGELDICINKILKHVEVNGLQIEDLPECPSRIDAKRYNVFINNSYYNELVEAYGIKSKRISLRRLLYYFIDNELYNEYGWEPINDYVSTNDAKINKQYAKVSAELNKLLSLLLKNNDDRASNIIHALDLVR